MPKQSEAQLVGWRIAVLDLIDNCPGLTIEQDRWLSRRVKELDLPSVAQSPAVSVLCEFAEGRISHLYQGNCPEVVSGHDSRDPDCPVCRAIDATRAGTADAQPSTVSQAAPQKDEAINTLFIGAQRHIEPASWIDVANNLAYPCWEPLPKLRRKPN